MMEETVKNQRVPFSFFPIIERDGALLIDAVLYTSTPWALVSHLLSLRAPTTDAKSVVVAFTRQAEEFFAAGRTATIQGAQPLLFYYAFMNLAKAISVAHGLAKPDGVFAHGLATVGYVDDLDSPLDIKVGDDRKRLSAFELFAQWIDRTWSPPPKLQLASLASQCLIGHRLWTMASQKKERFVSLRSLGFYGHNVIGPPDYRGEVGMAAYLMRGDPNRFSAEVEGFPRMGFDASFRCGPWWNAPDGNFWTAISTEVSLPPSETEADQIAAIRELVARWRPRLWRYASAEGPSYRHYYLYESASGEERLPQLVSLYALMFYLGSITRYQPSKLRRLAEGPYGPFLQEVLASVPTQFLYLVASELAGQEVASPGGPA